TSTFMKAPKPSVMNMPLNPTRRSAPSRRTSTSATTIAANASQERLAIPRSPRKTPSSSSPMAATTMKSSGVASRKFGTSLVIPLLLALGELRRGGRRRDLDALQHRGERRLHRPQEGVRIYPHPEHHRDHRHEDQDLAPVQVEHRAHVLAGDLLEDDPAIEVEHVGGAQDRPGGREERHQGIGLEGADQGQELADEAAGAGQTDRG